MDMNIRKIEINVRQDNRIFSDVKSGHSILCAFENKICSPDCAACYEDGGCNGKEEPFRPFIAAHCSRIDRHSRTIGELTNPEGENS